MFSKKRGKEFWFHVDNSATVVLKFPSRVSVEAAHELKKIGDAVRDEAHELEKIRDALRREGRSGGRKGGRKCGRRGGRKSTWDDLNDVRLDGPLCVNPPSTGFKRVYVKRVIFLLEELTEIAKRCNNRMVRRPEPQPPPPLASLLSGSLPISRVRFACCE